MTRYLGRSYCCLAEESQENLHASIFGGRTVRFAQDVLVTKLIIRRNSSKTLINIIRSINIISRELINYLVTY